MLMDEPFFNKCLTSGMLESTTNEIRLPEEKCEVFNLLTEWVYYRNVPKIDSPEKLGGAVDAWRAGDKYCMLSWQNELVDSMHVYFSDHGLQLEFVVWVLNVVEKGSVLYNLVLDQLAHGVRLPENVNRQQFLQCNAKQLDTIMEMADMSPTEIMMFAVSGKGRPSDGPCAYHVHPKGIRCCRSKDL